ncbi:MAG: alpha/beta hydrolase [Pseudomonadota bacterium]
MSVKPLREDEVNIAAPSIFLMLAEHRAWLEMATFRFRKALLGELPRGDSHPVLVIPGFGATDTSTRPLRRALTELGYAACTWDQGRNIGMSAKIKNDLGQRLKDLHHRHQKTVSLIGWSLGGVFVREMARAQPQLVRRVFTLGSPINGHPAANNVMGLFRLLNRGKPVNLDWDGFQKRRNPPPVPCVAMHSKSDGIVAWQCSIEEPASNTENVEVSGSHFGLGFNPQVLRVLAERLCLPE